MAKSYDEMTEQERREVAEKQIKRDIRKEERNAERSADFKEAVRVLSSGDDLTVEEFAENLTIVKRGLPGEKKTAKDKRLNSLIALAATRKKS